MPSSGLALRPGLGRVEEPFGVELLGAGDRVVANPADGLGIAHEGLMVGAAGALGPAQQPAATASSW